MNASRKNIPLERLNRVAWLLDNSIRVPGIDYRIGIDPLIGFVPGIGDAVGALLSLYIIAEAARAHLPLTLISRMVFNVAVETIVGVIPLAGDLFDLTWKANMKNARIVRDYAASPSAALARNRRMVWSVLAVLAFFMIAALYFGFLVLRWLWTALSA